jgi:hypothetical protein
MARTAFVVFKWTVYGLLAVNTWLYFATKPTLTPFIDQLAWITLLAMMEYESSTLDQGYSGPWERRILTGLTGLAYAVIVYAWVGYIREEEWLDVVNASAWLMICAVLFWQMYAPGDYEGWEAQAIRWGKGALYLTVASCALVWTIEASKPLDAVDAWLWLACFAVIELNVFGFEQRSAPAADPPGGGPADPA